MHINFELANRNYNSVPFNRTWIHVTLRSGVVFWGRFTVPNYRYEKDKQLFITYLFTDIASVLLWLLFTLPKQFKTEGSDVLFTCQHGPNECYGNKVHACAIQHIQVSIHICSYYNFTFCSNQTFFFFFCFLFFSPDCCSIATFCCSGEFVSKYKNKRIPYIRLCSMFDAFLDYIQRCRLSRCKMRKRFATTELARNWGVC